MAEPNDQSPGVTQGAAPISPGNQNNAAAPGVTQGTNPPAPGNAAQQPASTRVLSEDELLAQSWGLNIEDPLFREQLKRMILWETKKRKTAELSFRLENGHVIRFYQSLGGGGEFIGMSGFARRSFDRDDAKAVIATSRARGWKSVNVHGKTHHKEMLWLEAMRAGLAVTNFMPSVGSDVAKEWYKDFSQWLNAEAGKTSNATVQDALKKIDAALLANPALTGVEGRLTIKAVLESAEADTKNNLSKELVAYNNLLQVAQHYMPGFELPSLDEAKQNEGKGGAAAPAGQAPAQGQQGQKPPAPKTQWGLAPKKLVVVFHANCVDGSASAWAVMEKEGVTADDPNVAYIPYEHYMREAAENNVRGAVGPNSKVYFVDAAPEKAFLDELLSQNTASSVHVLDHHLSAAKMYQGYTAPAGSTTPLELKIDDRRSSAAAMVHQHLLPGKDAPDLFDVIDKADGAAKGLVTKEDKAAAAYVDSQDTRTIKSASEFIKGELSTKFHEFAKRGEPILADQELKLKKMLSRAAVINLQILPGEQPAKVSIVNGYVQDYGRDVSSELVALAKKNGGDIAMAWTTMPKPDGSVSIEVSMRSNGTPNLGDVAEHLKKTMGCFGGGHGDAAVIRFPSFDAFKKHILDAGKPPTSNPGNKP